MSSRVRVVLFHQNGPGVTTGKRALLELRKLYQVAGAKKLRPATSADVIGNVEFCNHPEGKSGLWVAEGKQPVPEGLSFVDELMYMWNRLPTTTRGKAIFAVSREGRARSWGQQVANPVKMGLAKKTKKRAPLPRPTAPAGLDAALRATQAQIVARRVGRIPGIAPAPEQPLPLRIGIWA